MKGGQHQMTDNKQSFNPYYKHRDLNTEKVNNNHRLPKELKTDLDRYFKDNDMSVTDGMEKIVMEFLNSKCLERKPFNYIMYLIATKDHDLQEDDFKIAGVLDYYGVLKDLDENVINLDEKHNETDKIPDVDGYYVDDEDDDYVDDYLQIMRIEDNDMKAAHFDNFIFDNFHQNARWIYGVNEKDAYVDALETFFKSDLDETFLFKIVLNNFLDEKSGGTFKGLAGSKLQDHHRGLAILEDSHGQHYYVSYDWIINIRLNERFVSIQNINFYEKKTWYNLIQTSANQKLKNFIAKQDDFKEIRKDNVMREIAAIDRQIQKLQQKRDACERIVEDIIDDNTLMNKLD